MADLNLSSTCVMSVIRSWETARQRNGFDETLGIDTLLLLFKMDPQIKQIFGFPVDKEVKAEGMQRMGILIHGLRIIKMLDLIFSVLGPDSDTLSQVLADMGEQHCKLGLSPDHFTLLCRALLEVLEGIMGDEWNAELRTHWFQVIRSLSVEIAKCMQKRMSKVCRKLTMDDMRGGEAVPRRPSMSSSSCLSGGSSHSRHRRPSIQHRLPRSSSDHDTERRRRRRNSTSNSREDLRRIHSYAPGSHPKDASSVTSTPPMTSMQRNQSFGADDASSTMANMRNQSFERKTRDKLMSVVTRKKSISASMDSSSNSRTNCTRRESLLSTPSKTANQVFSTIGTASNGTTTMAVTLGKNTKDKLLSMMQRSDGTKKTTKPASVAPVMTDADPVSSKSGTSPNKIRRNMSFQRQAPSSGTPPKSMKRNVSMDDMMPQTGARRGSTRPPMMRHIPVSS